MGLTCQNNRISCFSTQTSTKPAKKTVFLYLYVKSTKLTDKNFPLASRNIQINVFSLGKLKWTNKEYLYHICIFAEHCLQVRNHQVELEQYHQHSSCFSFPAFYPQNRTEHPYPEFKRNGNTNHMIKQIILLSRATKIKVTQSALYNRL